MLMRLVSGIWRGYLRYLDKYPIVTTALQTGILMGTGDVIAQKFVEQQPNIDIKRTARFVCYGTFIGGPLLRTWYGVLERTVKVKSLHLATLQKVSMDQLFFAPCFLTMFLGLMGVFRGDSTKDIKQKYERDFVPVLIANYYVWPAVQLINFYFTPLHHRVMVVNFVAIFWNTYLAWKSEEETPVSHDNNNNTKYPNQPT